MKKPAATCNNHGKDIRKTNTHFHQDNESWFAKLERDNLPNNLSAGFQNGDNESNSKNTPWKITIKARPNKSPKTITINPIPTNRQKFPDL